MKGQRMFFACPVWVRLKNQLRFSRPTSVHKVSRTGREKKKPRNRYAAQGHRSDAISREYIDLQNLPLVSVSSPALVK